MPPFPSTRTSSFPLPSQPVISTVTVPPTSARSNVLTPSTKLARRDSPSPAMRDMTTTLRSTDALLNPDSQTQYELRTMLQAVQSAAETMERLGEKLNRKPNALIFGEK